MFCMFSHWTKVFPCRQVTASFVGKVLLERIIFTCGIPLELHNNQGIYFIGQVLQKVCAIWPVLQDFDGTNHHQFSSLV